MGGTCSYNNVACATDYIHTHTHTCLSHAYTCTCTIHTAAADFTCNDGEIRLVDGETENEGRVEICFDNQFGTICDDDWDNNDASVICYQQGFGREGTA